MKKLILICALLFAGSSFAQVLEQDSLALVAFYNSTGGPNWNNNANWLTGPVSTWYGVIVEGNRIKELSFCSDNNLNGSVPEEVGNISEVETFIIGNNPFITGKLPESIGLLTKLKWFGIGNCSLTGTIPYTIENCFNLKQLVLSQNNLSGTIPPGIGNLDSLMFLFLHDNQLTGTIPQELGNCESLVTLNLDNNQLSGKLPENLGNIFKNSLHSGNSITLYLANNNFTDSIPHSWGDKEVLGGSFNFSGNSFSYIPPWKCWIIDELSIEKNKMTFDDIEPHFVGYMWYNYSPQDRMEKQIDTALAPGSNYFIYSGTGGEHTEYFWYRNNELILQSHEADTLFINNITHADTGKYYCMARNSLATQLTLYRRPVYIRIDSAVNIASLAQQQGFRVFPNPAANSIMLSLPQPQYNVTLKIYDMHGKCMFSSEHACLNNKTKIDVSSLQKGAYLLLIQTKKYTQTAKFIKNRQGINR